MGAARLQNHSPKIKLIRAIVGHQLYVEIVYQCPGYKSNVAWICYRLQINGKSFNAEYERCSLCHTQALEQLKENYKNGRIKIAK